MAFPMDIYLAEKTETSVTVKFKGTDTTLITPLIDELNANPDVKIVRFINKHPELEDTALFVEMRSGDALAAIEKAARDVAAYFKQ